MHEPKITFGHSEFNEFIESAFHGNCLHIIDGKKWTETLVNTQCHFQILPHILPEMFEGFPDDLSLLSGETPI